MEDLSNLISYEDACKELNRTYKILTNRIYKKHITPVRIGKTAYLRKEDFENIKAGIDHYVGRIKGSKNKKQKPKELWKISVFSEEYMHYMVKGVCFSEKEAKHIEKYLTMFGFYARASKHVRG